MNGALYNIYMCVFSRNEFFLSNDSRHVKVVFFGPCDQLINM